MSSTAEAAAAVEAPPVRSAATSWLARLFPPAPATPIGWRGPVLALVVIAAGVGVSLARQPGTGALDTVWAEDGQVFLGEAVRQSWLSALTTSYAGYYHLVPRLLAVGAAAVPPGAAAAALAISAAVCVAAVAVAVYVASAGHLTSRAARLAVAGIVVVLPLGQDELPNSIANLHWYGLYALFWLLLWTPAGRIGKVVAPVAVLLVAGSDILVAAFVPLALGRLVARRDRYSVVLGAVLTAGLAVQLVGLATGSSSRTLSPSPVHWLTGYLVRAVPAAMLGQRWFVGRVDGRWLALAALAWLLVAAALAAAVVASVRRWTRPNLPLAGAAVVYSVLLYALPVTLSGIATPRYAAAPAMLLVTALVALLQPAPATRRSAKPQRLGILRPAPIVGYLTLLLVICALNLRVLNDRAHGPGWREDVARARAACASTTDRTVSVPIAPVTDPPSWAVDLPCRYLQR